MRISIKDFERVYKKTYHNLYCFSYSFVGDTEASKDIVADSFTILWTRRNEIDIKGMESLLYTVVRNQCLKYLRQQKTNSKYVLFAEASLKEEDDNYLNDIEERIAEMLEVVQKLPTRTRFILEECYYNDRTYKEVADIIGISTSAVKKHIMNAYAALRKHFNVHKP